MKPQPHSIESRSAKINLLENRNIRFLPTLNIDLLKCPLLFAASIVVLPAVLGGCTGVQVTTHAPLVSTSSEKAASGNLPKKPLDKLLVPLKPTQTAPAELRELALPLHLNGIIEPDFNKEVDVTSHLTGRVKSLLVKLGDSVKNDQILAVVESQEVSELEAELIEAQSKVTSARSHERREKVIYQEQVERPKSLIESQTAFKDAGARRDLADSEFKRTSSLYKEKIVAAKDFHAAQSELTHAQAHYDQAAATLQREQHMYQNKALLQNDVVTAKAEVQRANQHLDTLVQRLQFMGMSKSGVSRTIATGKLSGELNIVAPVGGIITKQEINSGEVVHPDKPMFTITDLSTVLVRADLPETHLSRVKLGTGVKIKVAGYPDQLFSGKINFIAEHVNPETHMVAMRVQLENPRRQLKRDMSAEVDLEPQLAKVVVCPKSAVFDRKGQTHVFVKNARGSFDERSVIIGAETNDLVEVCSGLKADELVATDNLDKLRGEPGR